MHINQINLDWPNHPMRNTYLCMRLFMYASIYVCVYLRIMYPLSPRAFLRPNPPARSTKTTEMSARTISRRRHARILAKIGGKPRVMENGIKSPSLFVLAHIFEPLSKSDIVTPPPLSAAADRYPRGHKTSVSYFFKFSFPFFGDCT